MLSADAGYAKPEVHDVTLTTSDTYRLLGICIELIDLCSKVTGKTNPALGSIIEYARDEALLELSREHSCA